MNTSITPLQRLLQESGHPISAVVAATGRSRHTVRRWRIGETYPSRDDAAKLILLFGPENLDFNGCYSATVEVVDA